MHGLRYLALAALVLLGALSYFGIGTLIGAFRISDFRAALRRQR
jgi:putative peptidoglycan lipid II flippase